MSRPTTLDATNWPYVKLYYGDEEVTNALEAVPAEIDGVPVIWVAHAAAEVKGNPSRYSNNISKTTFRRVLRAHRLISFKDKPLTRRLKIYTKITRNAARHWIRYQIAKRTR